LSAAGASALGPEADGALELLVVAVGEPAWLLGAGGDEGSSSGDSAGVDELVGGEEAGLEDFGAEDFGAEDFGAGVGDDDLGAGTGEDFGVAAGVLLSFGDGAAFGEDDLGAGDDDGELLGEELAATAPATARKMSARTNN
jgi:hypothetical protein